jgi:Icc-related predicted phosphoesterase
MDTPLRILVLADLHSQISLLPAIAQTLTARKPEAVFCLGDLTVNGPSAAPFTTAFLETINPSRQPLLAVSGNNDDLASLALLDEAGCLLDQRERRLGEYRVIGLGYAPLPSPFRPDLRDAILLTHVPPRPGSVPPGVTNLPRFHFAGHLHWAAKVWSLGATTVVQVPTAMHRRAAFFTLPEGKVEFITLG